MHEAPFVLQVPSYPHVAGADAGHAVTQQMWLTHWLDEHWSSAVHICPFGFAGVHTPDWQYSPGEH